MQAYGMAPPEAMHSVHSAMAYAEPSKSPMGLNGGDVGGGGSGIAVMVPGDNIGRVIGKSGSGLKQIRESSGCKVNVEANGADPSAMRRVELQGQGPNIGFGASLVVQSAYNDKQQGGAGNIEAVLYVPNGSIGSVIGKGGENLKRVRETMHVRVQVEREPVVNRATMENERMMTISGDCQAICSALAMMFTGVSGGGGLPGPMGMMGMPQGGGLMMNPMAMGNQVELQMMPADDPDAVQIHFQVPLKTVGAIVGKQGAAISQLALQAGCKMTVTKRTLPSGAVAQQRSVVCVGQLPQVCIAQQLAHTAAINACQEAGEDATALNTVTATFWIPKEFGGAIIGKGGATLGQIREMAQVKVQFEKEENRGMRPCAITGPLQNVLQAENHIHGLIIAAR